MSSENLIWSGKPSQFLNFFVFLLFWWTILIPVWFWLQVNVTRYRITNERLFDESGIIFQRVEQMELIRIRDYEVKRSILQRILGLGDVVAIGRDRTSPKLTLRWVRDPLHVAELLRTAVEASKRRHRFREGEML
jgi:membrane protein YdbS with pleckstrin-like domain